ncbi:MAG: ABC transporter permease [Anaerolineales bacterium]|jgi:Cu-processing system permease protein
MTILVMARLTFREAARRRILLAALVLGLIYLVIYALGFYYVDQETTRSQFGPGLLELNQIRSFLFMAGLYVVNFLTSTMVVLTSVDTLSGEIASGTIHTLVSKPVQRWEIVLGKWLGFVGMLSLYLLLMAGGTIVLVYFISDYLAPNVLRGLGLMWMNAVLLLGVSLAGGAVLSTLANGVMVFGMFGIAFVGGWIEQFGSYVQNQTAVNVGIVSSLLIPSEALWKRAAYEMQSPIVSALGISPFTAASMPSLLMVIYGMIYAILALLLAVRLFSRRDL